MFSRSLRKAAKFAPKHVFAQQHAAKFAPSAQQRAIVKSLKDVYIEGGGLTDEEVLKTLQKSLGSKDEYVTKYPNTSLEEYGKQLNAELARPIYYDDAFMSFVNEMLGYKKEEIRLACTGKFPEVQKEPEIKLGDNSIDFDWDAIKKLYGGTTAKDAEINNMAKHFKRIRAYLVDNRNFQPREIDWKSWVPKLGKEAVEEVQRDVETVKKLIPRINAKKISAAIEDHFQPLYDRMKDSLIEDLPEIKKLTAELEKETPLLKTDQNGMPLTTMNTPEYLDEYHPDLRDQIIEEIEIGWWDTQYRDDRKKLKITPDALLTYNAEWRKRELDKIDDSYKNELTVAASITPEAKAFQQMYLDVIATAKKNYELEAEVSQLKYQIEAQLEEQTKKEGTAGSTKKEIDPSIKKILEKYSASRLIVKEFPGIKKSAQPQQQQQQQTQAEH